MKRVLLALSLLLYGAAFADKPEVAEEADVLRVQLAESRAELLAARIEQAKADLATLVEAAKTERSALQKKYKLAEGDQIDPKTREIKRAPKAPEPKKDVKK